MAFKDPDEKYRKFVLVGTSGGSGERQLLSPLHFEAMVNVSRALMAYIQEKRYAEIPGKAAGLILTSNGGVWTDHIAVDLYNAAPSSAPLTLRLPAEFKDGRFVDAGQNSPGAIANHFHRLFSHECWKDSSRSLNAITRAIDNGATVITAGRPETQKMVTAADAAAMVAFTFGTSPKPYFGLKPDAGKAADVGVKPGPAAESWRNCNTEAAKFHIPLQTILDTQKVIVSKFTERAKQMEHQRNQVQVVDDSPCPF